MSQKNQAIVPDEIRRKPGESGFRGLHFASSRGVIHQPPEARMQFDGTILPLGSKNMDLEDCIEIRRVLGYKNQVVSGANH